MNIDIVIPFKLETKHKSVELRMCLRSIEKHLKNYRDIWIIGQAPSWLKNCKVLNTVTDQPGDENKEHNIYKKLIAACSNPEISDPFCFLNDDHFLLRDFDATAFPYYHMGALYDHMLRNKKEYMATLNHSKKVLEEKGLPTLDFDCHCPVVYHKTLFQKAFEGLPWIPWGYAIKSLYCGMNKIEGEQVTDCKISSGDLRTIKTKLLNRQWFSTGNANPQMEIVLAGLFPKKSKFEL